MFPESMSHIARWIFVASRSFVPERLPWYLCVYATEHYRVYSCLNPQKQLSALVSHVTKSVLVHTASIWREASGSSFAGLLVFRRRPSGQGGAAGLHLTLNKLRLAIWLTIPIISFTSWTFYKNFVEHSNAEVDPDVGEVKKTCCVAVCRWTRTL